jgi:uncharacterized DUF497 family protein
LNGESVRVKVEYTAHARLRLEVRGIDAEEVENVLVNPQRLYYDVEAGTFIAVGNRPRRQGHQLLVVYVKQGAVYRVVTVIDTKSAERIAERREARGRWVRIW